MFCFRKIKKFIPFLIILGLLAFGFHFLFPCALASLGGWKVDSLNQGLVGHWPLDGAYFNSTTNQVADISGYENHGTNSGATLTTDRYGQANGAMGFGGDGIKIFAGNDSSLKLEDDMTIAMWINPSLWTPGRQILYNGLYYINYRGDWAGDRLYFLYRINASGSSYGCSAWADWGGACSSTVAFSQKDQWYHVLGIKRGYNLEFWIDGEKVDERAIFDTYTEKTTGFGNLHMGDFDGSLQDVRIYNRALSEDEIARLYESYKPKLSASSTNKGLAAHYPFDNFSEYTENLFPRGSEALAFTSAYNGSSYGFGASTNIQQEIDNSLRPESNSSITKVSRINSGESQRDYVHLGLSSPLNSTRVISFWYYGTYGTLLRPYNNDGSASLYYLDENDEWVGGGTGVTLPVIENQWQKIVIKMVNRGEKNGTGWSWFVMHNNNGYVTLSNEEYWAFTEFQVEEKSYSTPFIDGIREDLVKDNSGYFNHSTLDSNTPKWVEEDDSRTGVYEFFKGEQRRIQLPDPYLGTKTISFWVKVKAGEHNSAERVPFLVYNDGVVTGSGDTRQILLCMQDNKFRMHGWGTLDPTASSNINDGEWHHLVWHMNHHATEANQRLMNMWVDGTKEVTDFNYSQGSFGPVADSYWWVGYNSRSYSSYLRDAGVLIDDIRFYDRKLTDDEVDSLYHKGKIGSSVEVTTGSLYKGLVLDMPLTAKYTKNETLGSEIMADTTPYSREANNYGATVNDDYLQVTESSTTSQFRMIADDLLDFNQGTDFSLTVWVKDFSSSSEGGCMRSVLSKGYYGGGFWHWVPYG
ncbi:LamG domain-containing protein [Patescibacteria group bacterium]|nr:LamG domain-containing protein [Patescibacteria group bacterium]